MLFHISYKVHIEHRNAAQNRFKETGAPPPDGVKMLGRWHGSSGRCGFVLAESDNLEAVASWLHQWTEMLTFEIEPVLEDEAFSRVIGG